MCSCIAQNVRWFTGVLSNDIAGILSCTVLNVQLKSSHTLYVQYTRVSSWFSHHDIVLLASVFYMGKVHIVCIRCVLALHKMCVESRSFYPTISQRSCHVQHTTCSHNAAWFLVFNIYEFQAAFSTLNCTVSKCILLEKSAYNGHTVCSCTAQNVRWITVVLCNYIAAILPCTKQKPAAIKRPDTLCSIYKTFKQFYHYNIVL